MASGIAVSTTSWWFVAVFLCLYLLIYVPVMMAEAETLNQLFPDDYASYSQRVPMFFPRFLSSRFHQGKAGAGARFALSQYLKHREYRAAIGLFVIYALLASEMFFLK